MLFHSRLRDTFWTAGKKQKKQVFDGMNLTVVDICNREYRCLYSQFVMFAETKTKGRSETIFLYPAKRTDLKALLSSLLNSIFTQMIVLLPNVRTVLPRDVLKNQRTVFEAGNGDQWCSSFLIRVSVVWFVRHGQGNTWQICTCRYSRRECS